LKSQICKRKEKAKENKRRIHSDEEMNVYFHSPLVHSGDCAVVVLPAKPLGIHAVAHTEDRAHHGHHLQSQEIRKIEFEKRARESVTRKNTTDQLQFHGCKFMITIPLMLKSYGVLDWVAAAKGQADIAVALVAHGKVVTGFDAARDVKGNNALAFCALENKYIDKNKNELQAWSDLTHMNGDVSLKTKRKKKMESRGNRHSHAHSLE
jgi:hypothetical protein